MDEPGNNPIEKLLIEQLRKASPDFPHPLTRLTRLDSVADFDSLDAIEFVMFLEDRCSITVSEAAMAALRKPGATIADFASWLT